MFQHWQLQLPDGHHLWVPILRHVRPPPSPVWCGVINVWNSHPCAAGMNMSPVSRLKKTWGKAKTAKFFILEVSSGQLFVQSEAQVGRLIRHQCCLLWQHQMDPTGNFYNYRTALRGAAHRSRTANSSREKVELRASSLLICLHTHIFSSSVFLSRSWFHSLACWLKTSIS